ncbi:MAG: tetratricopeptide repeat protein [Verrucomicrobiia bacterium]
MPRFLPWLLVLATFAFYGFTLNRWVSPLNLDSVARISGWTWQREVMSPVLFLVTYPFRWLPAPQIPLALNLFSAACAALTLGLLARSVALLPQDRTDAQRKREHSDFSFLTLDSAWLPPVLAVVVCGLQMTFWVQATNYTGEMFDLLVFAFVIRLLLEYRVDEREGRLFLASLVYGASMTNNWAMLGFFPGFVGAIVWIRGLSFFNLQFLRRMVLWGLLGLAFYLLLPLLAVISGQVPMTFWEALKGNLGPQYGVVKFIVLCCLHPQLHLELLALFVAYLIPLFVLAIRWKASFGDHSPMGMMLTSLLFHVACAAFLVFSIWMAFDPPFSPRHLSLGAPLLTLYYLGALSIGYFSGYFLLIFGKTPSSRLQPPRPEPFQILDPVISVGVWVLAVAAVAGLLYRNTPQIREANGDTIKKYAAFTEENLPPAGGILLSDDTFHLFLVEAALVRDGRAKTFVPLDTHSLIWPPYLRFLHAQFQKKWPELVSAQEMRSVSPIGLIGVLTALARTNELYYLHPSFGYYFEQFYQEPHGLVYKMNLLPDGTFLAPLPDKNLIAGNEAFWSRVESQAFTPIVRAVTPSDPNAPHTWGEQWLNKFHISREPSRNAVMAGALYARSLDFWGVQLQRAHELEKAAATFASALKANPDNLAAQINLEFNQSLRDGKSVPVDLAKTTTDQFGKFHNWNEVLNANGPFDEPSFCLAEGMILASRNGLYRQAAAAFTRVSELVPDNLAALLWLAQVEVLSRQPDRALETLREPREHPDKFSLTTTNETELNLIVATAYFQKNELARGTQLLEAEMARYPNDDNLLNAAVQVYVTHGLLTNALALVDRRLRVTPDDPVWLLNKGYVLIQTKAYPDAIDALSRVLAIQTNNNNALFDRAVAYLNSGQLDAARTDYKTLQPVLTNSFQIAYGLGEIAWRKHETNEAINNYEVYLANANTNTAEATNIIQRLRELKGRSP